MEDLLMEKAIRFVCALGCIALLGFAVLGCSSDDDTFTLSGTLTRTTAPSPNGHYAYLKLVAAGGVMTDPALYSANSTVFSGEAATYSIPDIEKGNYEGYVFIDMDNSSTLGVTTSLPTSGDYTVSGSFAITDDMTGNVADAEWTAY
jgi:hypothetical protein